MAMMTQEQIEQLYRWWDLFQDNGKKLCEIRCLDGNKTYSGYYRNIQNIIKDIEPLADRPNMQVYFVLNEIKDDCYDRQQQERLVEKPKNTTSDNDIAGRSFILLDFDPERPSGVGSTDAQLKDAHDVAKKVYNFLIEQGFSSLIACKSGNGVHVLAPVMLASTTENTKLIERFLKAIAMLFDTETVHCDTKVGNPSRICKLYGTYAKKGSNTKEHPWRLAKFWKVPEEIKPNAKEYIEKVASLYPEEHPQPSKENNWGRSKFDIVDFLTRNGLEYRSVRIAGGTRYILKECPFNENHKDPDSMVFQHDNGALSFTCYHNSCSQYHWSDFRLHFEPEAYDKKDYRDYEFKRQHNMMKYQVKEPPQPLKEDNEKGPIWLKMSEIKRPKFNIANYIPSGIEQIDRLTVGFRRKHVTVWSGYRGSAKTTVLNMLILNAAQRGYKTALWTGELDGDEEKNWLYLQAAGKTYTRQTSVQDFYETPDNICQQIDPWIDKHMRIFNNKYGSDFQQIVDKVRELKKEWDLDVAIFDNLMTLDIDGLEGDKNERQKKLMIVLTELARENDMHIHVVAHPNKSGNFLRMNNISGTGNIPDLAQNVMILHRVNQDFVMNAREFLANSTIQEILDSKCTNCIEICKWRDKGSAVDHFIKLYFERESNRLKNTQAENLHYNWEEPYEEYTVPEEPQPLPTTIQPNQAFDTPIEPLYPQKEDDAYWGQFQHDNEPPF